VGGRSCDGSTFSAVFLLPALTALQAWIDYWAITGDDQYNNITTQAMLSNTGPENDYQPPRVYASLGNDDQAFWGIAALSAAERGFPDPPKDKPQWLALAQAVFNRQADRWDTQYCGGGLRWQVMSTNQGYNYKNAISNGLFFQMAARLARYTGNQTYTDWAEKVWDWTATSGLLTQKDEFYDGYSITDCQATGQGKIQWSYNAGTYLAGAAYMYDNYVRFLFHLRSLFPADPHASRPSKTTPPNKPAGKISLKPYCTPPMSPSSTATTASPTSCANPAANHLLPLSLPPQPATQTNAPSKPTSRGSWRIPTSWSHQPETI
jgi:hypothetical protein